MWTVPHGPEYRPSTVLAVPMARRDFLIHTSPAMFVGHSAVQLMRSALRLRHANPYYDSPTTPTIDPIDIR